MTRLENERPGLGQSGRTGPGEEEEAQKQKQSVGEVQHPTRP